jgi:nicotinamide phosphoribosyltransferase
MTTPYHPFLLCDFYKISHIRQYPQGVTRVYSTWIPRSSRVAGIDHVVAFGFQAFIKKYLLDYFNENFFDRDLAEVLGDYERIIKFTLGVENPDSSHLVDLWNLGYLPLEIKALPEGTRTPIRVPMLTIENTHPDFFWLTNALETLFSAEVWMPCTSATISAKYRELLDDYAEKTGADKDAVAFQGHDFSMRGMSSVESAAASGAGHLLSFTGTDSIPAILFHEAYYNADVEKELVGTSIPATEHSVMCAYGQDELESYRHLIEDVYPEGFISIVSDTWDLWKCLDGVIRPLKDKILARNGKVVIRPDSGDPADIICGTKYPESPHYDTWMGQPTGPGYTPEEKGVIEILWDIFGGTINEKGYRELDSHIGAIYGDAITLERAEDILSRLEAKGFASTNIVLGIGSFTYQYVTRDTFGFALKSTWVEENGVGKNIFKDPATDKDKIKKSLTGRVVVFEVTNGEKSLIMVNDGLSEDEQAHQESVGFDMLKPVFRDGELLADQTLAEVRKTLTGT